MATKRQRIIEGLHARLNGVTSVALRVYRGRIRFDSTVDTFPLISMVVGDSSIIETNGERNRIELPLDVLAVITAALDNPGDAVELLIGEIKTALAIDGNYQSLGADRAKVTHVGDGGIAHEEGDDYITASVRLVLEYVEQQGAPEI